MAKPVKAKDICIQVAKSNGGDLNMIKTCSRCGKEFDTNTCETYAVIQYEIRNVSKHSGRFGECTLCRDCEDHFNIFMNEGFEENAEYGQTSQS